MLALPLLFEVYITTFFGLYTEKLVAELQKACLVATEENIFYSILFKNISGNQLSGGFPTQLF